MRHPANKFIPVVALLAVVTPVAAQETDAYYQESDRSDFVALDAGDANHANIAIQTPTPWPPYLNNTHIPMSGAAAELVMQQYYARHAKEDTPQTVVNIGMPQN